MLFNSINFAIFLPVVFILYWFVTNRNLKTQNLLLLVCSYFFYASWDYRFLFLLLFSTLMGFYTGIKIFEAEDQKVKSYWLWLSMIVGLGLLGVFKYYNFFIQSFLDAMSLLDIRNTVRTLNVILPVGISFYTFHGMSYVLDIYKKRIEPTRSFVEYAVFVSFFPLLVAGPIERASHLLPQIQTERRFDYSNAAEGLRQILWGLFKKNVIADGCAIFVNTIFDNFTGYSGSTLALGAVLFAFQIYCDFSGYSDIALGTARLLGIELLRNFAFPYFSRDIPEFWRRWHISLSTWFRDYVYYPMERRRMPVIGRDLNILVVFLLTGLWHGANWTFVVWGLLNALYLIFSRLFFRNQRQSDIVAQGKVLPSFKEFTGLVFTFGLTVFAWIFFRAESVSVAFRYIFKMFSLSLFELPDIKPLGPSMLVLIALFLIVEWLGRERQYAIQFAGSLPKPVRWTMYYVLIFITFYFAGSEQQFIYFQF